MRATYSPMMPSVRRIRPPRSRMRQTMVGYPLGTLTVASAS